MFPHKAIRMFGGSDFLGEFAAAFRRNGLEPGDEPSIEVNYVRYKPGTSCLFGVRTAGPDGESWDGYVKMFETGGAEECFRKYENRGKDDGWAYLFRNAPAVYFHFPLDRSVRGLTFLVDVQRLKHRIHECLDDYSSSGMRIRARKSSLEILRYKPERRCIVKANLGVKDERSGARENRVLIAQAYAGEEGARTAAMMSHIRGRGNKLSFHVPAPLGYDAENRILFQEFVEGGDLYDRLNTPAGEKACAMVARALRDLQQIPLPAIEPKPLAWYIDHAAAVVADLARVSGDLGVAPENILRELIDRETEYRGRTRSVSHGDCHYHQFLIHGVDCALIDWDESCVGPASADAGNFLAHLHMLELEGRVDVLKAGSLREAFLDEFSTGPEERMELEFFVALHLLYLSLVPFRNLRKGWLEDVRAILRRAGALIGVARREEMA